MLIVQLLAVQGTVETFRVLATFDCSFNPQAARAYIMDALMMISFMFGMWSVVIVLRIDRKRLGRYKVIKKFLAFKVMIAVSKFLSKILDFFAQRGRIEGTAGLGASQRSLGKLEKSKLVFRFLRKLTGHVPSSQTKALAFKSI